MEKIILKWVTGCSGFLTVAVCVCLYFFPTIKETMVVEPEIDLAPEAVVQVQVQQSPTDIVEDDKAAEEYKEQLNIELPEGIDGSDITISNHYLTQTVFVRFDKGVDNYSDNYRVYGSSDYIASVGYYKEGEAGVLEIKLDQVCELSYTYREGFLCMDFIDPHEIYDKVIVVDAGHGGRAPEAVKKDVYEKNLNLAIVKQIQAIFEAADDKSIKVYYTRLDDTNPTLSQRVGLANKANADLFISIHNNSSASGKFNDRNGTMVLYNQADESEFSSKRFAEMCLQNVMETAGSNRRGLAKGNYVHIVKNSKVPVALIEVGYMTNLEELAKLQTEEYQKLVAQGVYNAVMQAFEEGY